MSLKYKPGLSVVLAVHNEEVNLPSFLASVKSIADEVVIVDGESCDRTVEIARKFGAVVISVPNQKNFHINKQIGIEQATREWILYMDADEIIAPALGAQIRSVVEHKYQELDLNIYPLFRRHMRNIAIRDQVIYVQVAPINGYFIARKNFFLGNYLMHSGVYPDGVIRLFKNGKGYLPAKSVHEQVVIEGGVSWLSEPMIHLSDPTFSRYVWRANRYTSLTAQDLYVKRIGTSFFTVATYLFVKPLLTTFSLFIRNKGFMDGFSGFVWAIMSGLHFPIAYMKYRELLWRDSRSGN